MKDKPLNAPRAGVALWLALLITAACMALLIFIVYRFNVPNPNMILIAGLVICSSLFGYPGGVLAGVIMLGYTLFFFSEGNDFRSFTDQNTRKVVVSLIGIVVDLIFVCELKRRRDAAFRSVHLLSEQLSEDNRLLQEASHIDGLTRVRNRFALRIDYPGYRGHELFVMMLDIDNFKQINDRYGHYMGDQALIGTAKLLSEQFTSAHCYRYGGDEFLVIVPDMDPAIFGEKLRKVEDNRPRIDTADGSMQIGYSIGCVSGFADADALRDLISQADVRMYEAKRSGKGQTVSALPQ